MTEQTYHLAQLNIAQMRAPMDNPIMADFVAQLDAINALAEQSPGFVWRLQSDSGNATDIPVFNDTTLIVNMSVWESIEALFEYAYNSGHIEVFRRKSEWFERMDNAYMVMWWIPAGHSPTVPEAEAKLTYLREHGATPLAFSFKQRFTIEAMLKAQEAIGQ